MMSQVLTDYFKNSNIDLGSHDLTNVKELAFEGQTKDKIICTIKCNPTQNRTVWLPDANITINDSNELIGTTLANNVTLSSLTTLGVQSQTLNMNNNNISNVGNIAITSISGIDSDDIAVGTTNKYYNSTLFNSDFNNKMSGDLQESASTHLFYTDSRAVNAIQNTSPTFNTVSITGSLTVGGTVTTVDTTNVSITDNIFVVNSNGNSVPTVPTNLVSGLQITRGSTQTDYLLVFVESQQSFSIGQVGSLQCVATRQDSGQCVSDGLMFWNSSLLRMDTSSTYTTSTIALQSYVNNAISALQEIVYQ